ncbi:phosphoglycerate mutase [Oscillochloris trichoides DG-6]|uniref:Phosphoglycerate mutase n=1 Tax=Oscillochloris trichoides DG-6 TaxID=765420 RepID=E1IBX0_9CHLR|nr:histidine phosphatase family protein [Oscillochloris trichoides]EFO81298.1 phosphoglycerate mutase [Oscillochloris trichoides DG-6]
MRTSIWLVRHGQTQANRQRRYLSHSDSPITSYGEQQIAALVKRLRPLPFNLAITSPRERTQRTAGAILAGRGQAELLADPAWAEVSHGIWEGLTYAEVMERFPQQARARWAAGVDGKAEGGESLVEASGRVLHAWNSLLQTHPGGRILIVTHATPIQIILCAATGVPLRDYWRWRIDLGSLTCLDVYPTGTIMRMVNEVPEIR